MITKIDIKNFGSFVDFKHTNSEYNKLNIFFGENYSGKSTLSKVLQSFEWGELPDKYGDIEFCLTKAGKTLTQKNVAQDLVKCKVYNKNYVNKYLKFEENIDIESFAILGKENIDIMKELQGIEEEITDLEINKEGKLSLLNAKKNEIDNEKKKLENLCKKHASKIKQDFYYFRGRKYDKNDLKSEISKSYESIMLDKKTIESLRRSITEEEKVIKTRNTYEILIDFVQLNIDVDNILDSKVSPSRIIAELENEPKKQQWVKEGLGLHNKEAGEHCAFCGNNILKQRFDLLDAYFSDEVSKFENIIESKIKELKKYKKQINELDTLFLEDYYEIYQGEANSLKMEIDIEKQRVDIFIEELMQALINKKNNLFDKSEGLFLNIPRGFNNGNDISTRYNDLYNKNKKFSKELEINKESSRKKLRQNYIKEILLGFNYQDFLNKLNGLEVMYDQLNEPYKEIEKNLAEKKQRKDLLEPQVRNEQKAAELVNGYLNSQLGHRELSLEINKENANQTNFRVTRYGEPAYNLSEGEQTLISFAYYLASLSDVKKEETVLFIDDPISSLDRNNIFYIYSLISAEIAKKEYKQVFITTHNMDFLKYLMELPTKEKRFFLINKLYNEIGGESNIKDMPKFLKKSVTEFNFLFEQIYKVASEEMTDDNYDCFYSFPNNARKFIETLLYFNYPDYQLTNDVRITKYFEDAVSEALLKRINNEYSHGEKQFDRMKNPVVVAEFANDARLILNTINKKSPDQYKSLLANSKLSDI